MSDPASPITPDAPPPRSTRRRLWVFVVRPLILVAVSLFAARVIVSFIGEVDWSAVGTALGKLTWAQVPLLIALLLVRQVFNSVPLAVFVPGLGIGRAFQNDLTANLIGTLAPPPGDVVLRISMFRSWGIRPLDGMPGVTLNSLTFYAIRFGVPALGALLLVGQEASAGHLWLALGSLAVAVGIVVALILVARGERLARAIGRRAGLVAGRFREDVEPEQWSTAVSTFRDRMSERLVKGLAPALVALAAMVVTDAVIVLVALRIVGIPADQLPVLLVIGTFLVAYPLTALPLAGLGVLDAVLLFAFTEAAGLDAEPVIVAALIVWRVLTIPGTLVLGGLAMGWWRWRTRGSTSGAEPNPADVR